MRTASALCVGAPFVLRLLLVASAGCGRAAPDRSERAAPAQPAKPAPGHAAAFELATFGTGALLAWAPARARGGGIWLQPLDARGAPLRPARRVAQTDAGGEVMELAAVGVGGHAGLAWVESSASEARTRALWLRPDEASPAEPTRIAGGAAVTTAGRTRLALAPIAQARMRVLYADAETECIERATGPCVGYGFREIGEGARLNDGRWLAVPQPCPRGVPSLAVRADRLYYAVCATRDAQSRTVAYSINMTTEYARADEVLAGCDPLAMLALDDGALLVADCNGVRRGVELTLAPQPAVERELSEREVLCGPGATPVLRAGGVELALRGPRDRLESLLPDALAPPGARAVWTGRTLLIAHPAPDGLELVALSCQDGVLR